MLRPVRPAQGFSHYIQGAPQIRSLRPAPLETAEGPVVRQLGALLRRRRLRVQQEGLRTGTIDYSARPPYPPRPRPPS